MISPILSISLLATVVNAVSYPIEIHGNKFFNSSDGNQFFIKGVAYQRIQKEGIEYKSTSTPGYIDSLANPDLCLRDLEYLKELGVNTVRVYQVDPTQNHDVCMNAFANYGIYVLADLGHSEMSINRQFPAWDVDLYDRFTGVVDALQLYPNLLGFYIGNEVVTSKYESNAAPFARAAVRDIKRYIGSQGYRKIPVGYASNDDSATRQSLANFFVCDSFDEGDSVADFYSINMFEWCGYSSYATSGYKERTAEFSSMPVPVFFSEFGCNTVSPRPFTEMEALYGSEMLKVWSGGVVFEFFQNKNRYGLVEEKTIGTLVKLEDFTIVQLRFAESRPIGIQRKSNSIGGATIECPAISQNWNGLLSLPPLPDKDKCECLESMLSCVINPDGGIHELDLLGEVCSEIDCQAINNDGASGIYGPFSGCSIKQRISYALNEFWKQNSQDPEVCNFDSRAVLKSFTGNLSSSLQRKQEEKCKSLIGDLLTESKHANATKLINVEHAHTSESTNKFQQYKSKNEGERRSQFGVVTAGILMVSLIYFAT